MDTFISIDRKIGDGGDTQDLALPLSSGDLTVKDVGGGWQVVKLSQILKGG